MGLGQLIPGWNTDRDRGLCSALVNRSDKASVLPSVHSNGGRNKKGCGQMCHNDQMAPSAPEEVKQVTRWSFFLIRGSRKASQGCDH